MSNRLEAEKSLARLDDLAAAMHVSGFFPAQVWIGLGETNQALQCLEKAVQQRSARIINQFFDPRLDPLRSHPRFKAISRKLTVVK